jgi:hypothetical protein
MEFAQTSATAYNMFGSRERTQETVRHGETATPIGQRYSSGGRFLCLFSKEESDHQ